MNQAGRWLGVTLVVVLAGCGSSEPMGATDSGPRDGGARLDASAPDAGAPDGGPLDAGPPDGGPADAGPPDAAPPPECTESDDCDDGNECNGVEVCDEDGSCVDGTAIDDGSDCDADATPATRDICVDGSCSATRCGDSFTDTVALEQCDDGNGVSGDGCDDCRFSCDEASDCDDAEACNGAETCSEAHICTPGTVLATGTECAGGTGRCVAGTCLPDSCEDAGDCDDGDLCDGAETCEPTGCAMGTTLDCDDEDACTSDGCAPASGCSHALIDADGDGYAPTSLGACGTDCDDTRGDIGPDAAEVCGNTRDDDCDGETDEVASTVWYADCDRDSYALMGARMLASCSRPAPGLSMCATGGGWTSRDPAVVANRDCNDGNAAVSPAQTMFQTTAISGADAARDFDYDCDATEEQRASEVGSCTRSGLGCVRTEGWASETPACGETAEWITACNLTALSCSATTEERTQACR